MNYGNGYIGKVDCNYSEQPSPVREAEVPAVLDEANSAVIQTSELVAKLADRLSRVTRPLAPAKESTSPGGKLRQTDLGGQIGSVAQTAATTNDFLYGLLDRLEL